MVSYRYEIEEFAFHFFFVYRMCNMSYIAQDTPYPHYTLGFTQSGNEYQRQLVLTARYASNPHDRKTALQHLYPSVSMRLDENDLRPFPKYAFETTNVTCSYGNCQTVTQNGRPMQVKRNAFGL